MALYESLKDYILTEEKLIEYNYPVQHPEKPGCAALFVDNKKITGDRELMLFLCHSRPHLNHALLEMRVKIFQSCDGACVLLVEAFKRICCRCGATYSVNSTGKHIRMEECNYHYGKGITKKGKYLLFPHSSAHVLPYIFLHLIGLCLKKMNSSRWGGDPIHLL